MEELVACESEDALPSGLEEGGVGECDERVEPVDIQPEARVASELTSRCTTRSSHSEWPLIQLGRRRLTVLVTLSLHSPQRTGSASKLGLTRR